MSVPPKSDEESSAPSKDSAETKRPARSRLTRGPKKAPKGAATKEIEFAPEPAPVAPPPPPEPPRAEPPPPPPQAEAPVNHGQDQDHGQAQSHGPDDGGQGDGRQGGNGGDSNGGHH